MTWVDPELAAEFPQLRLHVLAVDAGSGRTPREVKERLRALGDRYTAGKAINLRRQDVPWAYRVFFRQIGIDPDEQRTPAEAVALRRMHDGGFSSAGMPADAITIATAETGVGVVAFDAARVQGELGLRAARAGERLGGDGLPLPAGRLVIADAARCVAVLFGEVAPGVAVGARTERMLFGAIQVRGVPDASVAEALWTVAEIAGAR